MCCIRFIPLAFFGLTLLLSVSSHGEFLAAGSGYQLHLHTYLSDTSQSQTLTYEAEADLTHYRRSKAGPFARGPKGKVQQGLGFLSYEGQAPIYHWHHQHGVWVGYSKVSSEGLEAEIGKDRTYLANSGGTIDLTKGSPVTSASESSMLSVFWRSEARHRGVANMAGLYRHALTSPMTAEIENQSAEIFDGTLTGWGLMVGRHRDNKGFNFQWLFMLGQNQIKLSEDALPGSARSQSESRQHHMAFTLGWHYRYYLAPYWYVVPYVQQQVQLSWQSKSLPETIEHSPFLNSASSCGIQLRYYF